MFPAFKGPKDDGPGSKDQTESRIGNVVHILVFQMCQMSHGSKDGKPRNDGEHAVGKANNERISKGRLAAGTVTSIGRHGPHGDAQGKENLTHSRGPHVRAFREHVETPFANVGLDTVTGAFER